MDQKFVIKKLSNDIRCLFIQIKNTNLIQIDVNVLAGMYSEDSFELGGMHFLEHFNGYFTSKKYPDGRSLETKLNFLGTISNASTSDYYTTYWIKGQKKNFDIYLDIISNAFYEFVIDESMFKQEKNAVIEELHAMKSERWFKNEEDVASIFYPNHPASQKLKDEIKNVRKLKANNLKNLRKKFYNCEKTLIILTGDFKIDSMFNKIKNSLFGKIRKKGDKVIPFPKLKYQYIGPQIAYTKIRDSDSTKIRFIYKTNFDDFSKNRYILQIINKLLISDFDSRLYKILRMEKGLIYSLGSELSLDDFEPKLSEYEINTEASFKNFDKIIKYFLIEINRLKNELITDKELEKCKNIFITQKYNTSLNQDFDRYISFYSKPILWENDVITFKQAYDSYDKITKNEVLKLCNDIFNEKNLLISYSGTQKLKTNISDYISQ